MTSALLWMVVLAGAGERLELEVARGDDVNVVPAGEHGVVLYIQRKDDKKAYEIRGYDPDFTQTWTTSVPVPKNAVELARDADDGHAWVLSQKRGSVTAVRTDLATGQSTPIEVDFARTALGEKLRANTAGGAWVSGVRGRHGMLTWVGPDGQSTPVDLGKKRLVQSLTRGEDGTMQAAVRGFRIRPGDPLTVHTLGDGAIERSTEVHGPDDLFLLTGRSLALEGDDLVVGTWQPAGRWFSGARGLYVAGVDDSGAQTFFKHWRFDELEHFLDWLPEKRQDRVEKKVAKRKDKGKATNFRFTLLVQDPIETERGTLLIAESYYPVTTTYTTTTTTSNGQGGTTTTTTTHTVFLGWRFTHAMIAEIDGEGEMLWDASIPIQSRLTSVVRPHVRAVPTEEGVDLVAVRGGRLHRSTIVDGGLVDDPVELTLEDTGGEDSVKNLAGDAVWWFDDRFLLYGTDRVKDEDGKGRVFFFSRLDPEEEVGAVQDIGAPTEEEEGE